MITHLKSIAALLLITAATGCDSSSNAPGPSNRSPFPSKSVSLICPWAAGGGTDRLSRFMADQLQQTLGKPVVVVNRTGGAGAVGHAAGATAQPDGHTITMATFELSTMHWMGISDLTWTNYRPVIELNADAAAIVVQQDAPWKTLQEFLDAVRREPGKIKMSGTATGGAWDLARAGLLLKAGLPVSSILWVPAQGSAPSLVDLLGGHIDSVCCSVPEAASQIESGQLRVLAVMAPERLAEFPSLPTAREQGVAWDAVGWRGLVVPVQTPSEIVELLYDHCRKIVDSESFATFMRKNGFAPSVRGPGEFAAFLEEQDRQWEQVIEAAGYRQP